MRESIEFSKDRYSPVLNGFWNPLFYTFLCSCSLLTKIFMILLKIVRMTFREVRRDLNTVHSVVKTDLLQMIWPAFRKRSTTHTVNPAHLASSYVWQMQLYFLHISLFKITKRKYFIQSKCEFMKILFVLLNKIKILPLYTVYLPHKLLHRLFFTPFRNFWATVFLN